MATVNLYNDNNIVVTTAIVSGRLQMSVNGQVLGEVDDTWDPGPPPTTRMTIVNLPDGTPVTAKWQPWAGGGWTQFVQTPTGCYYDFNTPPPGGENDYRFEASLPSEEVCDPKLVLRTKVTEDE
jgi:hypothetical protein